MQELAELQLNTQSFTRPAKKAPTAFQALPSPHQLRSVSAVQPMLLGYSDSGSCNSHHIQEHFQKKNN